MKLIKLISVTLFPVLLASVACKNGHTDAHSTDARVLQAVDADPLAVDAGPLAVDAGPLAVDATASRMSAVYALGRQFDAGAGTLTKITVPGLEVSADIPAGVASNPGSILRTFDGLLYVVDRGEEGNIYIVDLETSQLVAQFSIGFKIHPQDVAVVGGSIYVCAFWSRSIIVLDAANPTATPETIDISSYDVDGMPECISIVESNGMLFASLGLFEGLFVSHGGKILTIDPSDNTVKSDVNLPFSYPFGHIAVSKPDSAFGGDLLVSTLGQGGLETGCVVRVTTGDTAVTANCLVSNADLGSQVTAIKIRGDEALLALGTTGELVRMSANGTVAETPLTPDTQRMTDFAICPSGELVTNDLVSAGLRIYAADGPEITSTPLEIGVPTSVYGTIVCYEDGS